jgi:hypothetical protein
MQRITSKNNIKGYVMKILPLLLVSLIVFANVSFAAPTPIRDTSTFEDRPTQTLQNGDPNTNPNDKAFKVVVCDGPAGLKKLSNNPNFVVCDFNGLMRQVQHLINIMMVVGVLVAIFMFSYAGYLYITGVPGNITKAHAIFPKVFTGFIIMLSAWFVVYQILSWLTNNDGFKTLLGNP